MFPIWLINNQTKEVFKISSIKEEERFYTNNPNKYFTVCDHDPTEEDINYYVYGIIKIHNGEHMFG